MFLSKLSINDKSEPLKHQNKNIPDQKVIILLVDALREDFIEMGEDVPYFLNKKQSVYTGRKIQLFDDLLNEQPKNTFLSSQLSEMPTVTSVRVKSLLTGSLNAFFEMSENFGSEMVSHDNILYQLKQTYKDSKIVFAGDFIWLDMFSQYFDVVYPYPSFNVADLDTLDIGASNDMLKVVKLQNFTLLIGHIIGVDHAGHTYGPQHIETERKLNDTEAIIKQIIDLMDDKTTLLVFGDHGMTDGGNHGGGTDNELRTAFFAYAKQGLPNKKRQSRHQNHIDKMLKQMDIASIVSSILNISLPFSNLGVLNPVFRYDGEHVNDRYLMNLQQLENYVITYCGLEAQAWCEKEKQDIQSQISKYQKSIINGIDIDERELEVIKFMNAKYKDFQGFWTTYDDIAIYKGIIFLVYLLAILLIHIKDKSVDIVILVIPFAILIPLTFVQIFAVLACAFVILKTAFILLRYALVWSFNNKALMKYEYIVCTLILIIYLITSFTDSFVQEHPYVVDSYLMLLLSVIVITTNQTQFNQLLPECLVIILCIKLAYFYDKETSMNDQTAPELQVLKNFVIDSKLISVYLSAIMYVIIYQIQPAVNLFERVMNLSMALALVTLNELQESEYKHMVAKIIIIASFIWFIITFLRIILTKQNESFSNKTYLFAIINILYVLNGPNLMMSLTLMVIQTEAFMRILNKVKVKPSIFTVSIFIYMTIQQYFYRTSHRERFNAIQFGKVYLGFTEYNFQLHGLFVLMNTYTSHIMGFLMIPAIIKNNMSGNESHSDDLSIKSQEKREDLSKSKDKKYLSSSQNQRKIITYLSLLMLFFASFNLVFSGMMCAKSKRELIWPQRSAPRYIFDLFQTFVFLIFSILSHANENLFGKQMKTEDQDDIK
ncbi:gpi ethanolamine phosphate transferase 3-like [Stylonychia lemnae]|uniref:Gpi ethanolamine phosphate transferase 3-like n=1 Tax=Stylonychia lemnae TaxID=5949 RepID=A0A078A2A9_STYLE|nr:gpi ethanolamine phosphate transferase 3-like [Stylonychia lemnae]|eukprot:CDW75957.1 gpi ethanolamine phosphate transferase 3-like [Stylonychia lemnae]